MLGGGYNCITTESSRKGEPVLKLKLMEEKAMNTKKITALALAALMAAGSTATAFADAADKDKALTFGSKGNLYGEDDGVIVKDDDNKFNPGDTIYVQLKADKDATDKEIDRMKVYADWKVGGDHVKSVDILYKKGEVATGKVEFTIDGKKLVANSDSTSDIEAAIKAVAGTDLKIYFDGIVARDYAKKDGFKDATKWYAADAYNVIKANEGFKVKADEKYYANTELNVYTDATFTVSANGLTLFAKDANPTEKVGDAAVGTGAGATSTQVTANVNDWKLTGNTGAVKYMQPNAGVDDFESAQLIEKVSVGEKIVDKTTRKEAAGVQKVSGTVYAKADGSLLTDESAALDEAVKAEAAKVKANAQVANNYTYWVEIQTKDSNSTKELDVAGTLYLGTSKNKAEDKNNEAGIDFTLSNRVSDYNKPGIVEDDYTFEADKNGAVKFSDDAEEVTLYFGSKEDAWFTFNAKGQSALNFGYTLKFNKEIADLFPKANIDFISWNAEPTTNRTGDLYITAEEDTFLYEVTENGIKEVKGAKYDENEGAWHLRTRKLTAYAISDIELDTTVKVEGKDEASSNSSTSSKPNGGKQNPDTGR